MQDEFDSIEYDFGENPHVWLATVDNDQPRVRPMSLWFFDTLGFYFHTGKQKNVFHQICCNPLVEFAINTSNGDVLRFDGKAEILEDYDLMSRLQMQRPWVFSSKDDHETQEEIVIFRVVKLKCF